MTYTFEILKFRLFFSYRLDINRQQFKARLAIQYWAGNVFVLVFVISLAYSK